jgi:hypothetical protein
MHIENKGVIDNRERPDSILFLCSFCVPLMMLYRLDLSSIQPVEFIDHQFCDTL